MLDWVARRNDGVFVKLILPRVFIDYQEATFLAPPDKL